jgi:hypothetical protein
LTSGSDTANNIAVTVTKKQIAKPAVTNTNLVYNDSEQNAGIAANAAYTVIGDKGVNANAAYSAAVVLNDKDNYEWVGGGTDDLALSWSIAKAGHNMSGATFGNKSVQYNGESHSITVSGLPDGVEVSEYLNNGQTEIGVYTVTVKFKVTDTVNYNVPADMTATLTVTELPPVFTISVTGGTASAAAGEAGMSVTLTAGTAPAGKRFKEWLVVSGGVTVTNNTFTIGTDNVIIEAVWEDIAAGAAVNTPTASAKTHDSITINAVTAPASGQTVEYAISKTNSADGLVWQDGLTFTGLDADTAYYVFARSKANETHEAGAPCAALTVTTGKAAGGGLGGGAIAGIVIGAVVLLCAAGFCAYWFVYRKKKTV